MLQKTKVWWQNKKEKAKSWLEEKKPYITFGLGVAVTSAVFLAEKMISKPTRGCIEYDTEEYEDSVVTRVFWLDHLGREHNPINVRYKLNNDNLVKNTNKLFDAMYSGD